MARCTVRVGSENVIVRVFNNADARTERRHLGVKNTCGQRVEFIKSRKYYLKYNTTKTRLSKWKEYGVIFQNNASVAFHEYFVIRILVLFVKFHRSISERLLVILARGVLSIVSHYSTRLRYSIQ